MKKLILALVLTTAAFAQLVEKAPAPTAPKKTSTTARATKKAEKDLNDTIGIPRNFVGGLIEKKRGILLLSFVGTWITAPAIGGGSSSITYSKRSADLADFLTPEVAARFSLSFNLGKRDDKIIARLFKRDAGDVSQMDEGFGVVKDGLWRFDMDGYTLVFKEAEGPWKPTSTKLYLWSGNDLQMGARPVSRTTTATATQVVPTWAAGSYAVQTNGFLGKAFFRFFAGSETYIAVGMTLGDESSFTLTRVARGRGYELQGEERISHLWTEGLSGFGTKEYKAIPHVALGLKKDWDLQKINCWHDASFPGGFSEISGTRSEKAIESTVETEILERSVEAGWAASAGPYSLRRLLLKAYKDCTLVEPRQADWPMFGRGYQSQIWDKDVANDLAVAREEWNKDASDAGATLVIFSKAPDYKQKRSFALGRVMSSVVALADSQASEVSEPGAKQAPASQGMPAVYPGKDGAYVLADGQWIPLPKNGGKNHQSISDFIKSARDTGEAKLSELVFTGKDAIPKVNPGLVVIAYVGEVKTLPQLSQLQQEVPQMKATSIQADGTRSVDLVRIVPGVAGFGSKRVRPLQVAQPEEKVRTFQAMVLRAGTYAIDASGGNVFELEVTE